MSEINTASGIYAITCRPNGRRYIGSSKRLSTRWYTHQRDLRRGSHRNTEMQQDYAAYGLAAFDFEVLQEVDGDLKPTEQRIITEHRRAGADLYNVRAATHQPVTTDAEMWAALEAL